MATDTIEIERAILRTIAWASTNADDWQSLSPILLSLDPNHFGHLETRRAYTWAREAGRTAPVTVDAVVTSGIPVDVVDELIPDMTRPPLLMSEPVIRRACDRLEREGLARSQATLLAESARAHAAGDTASRDTILADFFATLAAKSTYSTVGDLATRGLAAITRDVRDDIDGVARVGTGFDSLDAALGSMRAGGLMFLGARTSSGKTALCLSIGLNMARNGIRSGMVSIEDNETRVGQRLMSSILGASIDTVRDMLVQLKRAPIGAYETIRARDPKLFDDLLRMSSGKLKAPDDFAVVHPRSASLESVESECRSLVHSHGARLLLVDYVQAVRLDGTADRAAQLHHIAGRLKELANHLDVPLILTSQLRRPPEKAQVGEPSMHELRGAGELEEIGEWVALLWRDQEERTCLKLEKNKQGPVGGRWWLQWSPGHLTVDKLVEAS